MTVPIVDGIVPPATAVTSELVKARVDFYGNYAILTDKVQLTVEDRVLNETTRLLAQNFGETLDEITRDVLASTSSVLQASNGSNGLTPTEMTKSDTDGLVKLLLGNDAKMISKTIKGRDAYATVPQRPAFYGFIHTDLLDDLEAVASFVNSSNYASLNSVLDFEWGSTGNIRWLYTSIGSFTDSDPIVYNNIVVGQEAYGVVNLRSSTGEFYVEPLGSGGTSDPLHQKSSVGWKHAYVSRILNDAFMGNLQTTHS